MKYFRDHWDKTVNKVDFILQEMLKISRLDQLSKIKPFDQTSKLF